MTLIEAFILLVGIVATAGVVVGTVVLYARSRRCPIYPPGYRERSAPKEMGRHAPGYTHRTNHPPPPRPPNSLPPDDDLGHAPGCGCRVVSSPAYDSDGNPQVVISAVVHDRVAVLDRGIPWTKPTVPPPVWERMVWSLTQGATS